MNFMLIQFLATSVVGIFSVVAQAVLLQSQEWQKSEKSEKSWNGFNFAFITTKKIMIMGKVEENQSAQSIKGLQQRRSYHSLVEQEQMEVLHSVEMRRTGSSQSSLKSEKSTSSLKSEGSSTKESEERIPGQPNNFGTVVPGVYRSSYPQEVDYPFLQKLGLKTIVTLVDKEMPETFLPFMKANGIQHRHITMEGTKKQAISVQTMSTILEVIHDKKNHPLLIHCNQGRHRTGCVVAITRKVQQWNADRILDEYKTYASPKIRDGDVEYISNFQATDIEHLGLIPLVEALPVQATRELHRPRRLYVVAIMIIMVFLSISDIIRQPDPTKRRSPSLGL